MVSVPLLVTVPRLLSVAVALNGVVYTAEPLIVRLPAACMVNEPPASTSTELARAVPEMTGSLAASGTVTFALASGTPADQLAGLSQSESTLPFQVVCAVAPATDNSSTGASSSITAFDRNLEASI